MVSSNSATQDEPTEILKAAVERSTAPLVALALFIIALGILCWFRLQDGQAFYFRGHRFALDLSLAQLMAAPFLLFALVELNRRLSLVPKVVFLVALTGYLLGAALSFSYHRTASKHSFLVSRLDDDEYEAVSHIFREGINGALGAHASVSGRRYFGVIKGQEEAEELLESDPNLLGVIWGNSGHITINFPNDRPLTVGTIAQGPFAHLFSDLLIIRTVPSVSLSFEPSGITGHYLALIMRGISGHNSENEKPPLTAELDLHQAAQMAPVWRSPSHLAFAWFQLGNHYLVSAFSGKQYEAGVVECALTAYGNARKFLKFEDNPELFLAVRNNEALGLYLQGTSEGRPELVDQAVSRIRGALDARGYKKSEKVAFGISKTLVRNLFRVRNDS